MFIGEYRHTFDAKNRISVPAKFRKELGAAVVVTRGFDKCLFVFSKTAWKEEAKQIARHSMGNAAGRAYARFVLSGASEAEVDTSGRILVPEYLKDYAGLSVKSVVAGVSGRVEIWDEKAWESYTKSIEKNADEFAESIARVD
jgi:MraZ protein